MEFFSWFFSDGTKIFLDQWKFVLESINHNFSPILLIKTLFAPWKRLSVSKKSSGFNPGKYFEDLTFNLYSRLIGAVVRIILFIFAIFLMVIVLAGGMIGLILWVMCPLFSIPFYRAKKNDPKYIAQKIIDDIVLRNYEIVDSIFDNNAGQFLVNHTGVDIKELKNLKTNDFERRKKVLGFSEVVENYIKNTPNLDSVLNKSKLKDMDLLWAARWWDKKMKKQSGEEKRYFGTPGIGLELLFGYTPLLNQTSSDLTVSPKFSNHLIGREDAISRIHRVLQSGKNVIIKGPPGVGKKTVILEFAYRAALGKLGVKMAYRRIVELNTNAILSQSKDLNEKKQMLGGILAEASRAGNILLVIRDIEKITNAQVEGYDFTSVFEPVLEKRELKIIAISQDSDYERYIVPNHRIAKYFEPVEIAIPTKEEAMTILIEAAENWEEKRKITITTPALRRIIESSDRYITETPFPEKALEVLDEIITTIPSGDVLTVENVNQVLQEKTGIPFTSLNTEDKVKLGNLEETIHKSLVNQKAAIESIARSLRSSSTGLKNENRPIGSFLFLGPTGVGKTETAKVLAKVYYGSENAIIRFDMAEYAGNEGLQRLIGSVSQNQIGALTTAIKNKPASILLLDEIEKSPSEVFNLFLTLLEDGYITDAFGKKINCQNLLVIATSNAGAVEIRRLVSNGTNGPELQRSVLDYIQKEKIFAPEFINRFDAAVVYEPLTRENLESIADLMLENLKLKLRNRNITLLWSKETAQKLASDGYDPAFGARPMRRIVDLILGDLLGKGILNGEIEDGSTITLLPGVSENEYTWQKA